MESLIDLYVLDIIPTFIYQSACSKLHLRLACLSDSLIQVARRLAFSIDTERVRNLVLRIRPDLYESRNALLVLNYQFTSGYLWNSAPKEDIENLIETFSEMKLFDSLDFRKFQCLYLAINTILSISKFYQMKGIKSANLEKLIKYLIFHLQTVFPLCISMMNESKRLFKSSFHVCSI